MTQEITREYRIPTEGISGRYAELDVWPTTDVLAAMYEAQLSAAAAVRESLASISAAVDDAAGALMHGGRLIYVGAGTSARIGVQDGAELTPTFDWSPDRVVFLIAGGIDALIRSVEGAEDDESEGVRAAVGANIAPNDVVAGIAASGTTPYVLGALKIANARGAVTIALTANPEAPILRCARHKLIVKTGQEVIAGSTRMKAGTAQKIALNLFSTALMVRIGRIYRGLMVHMRATNAKLRRRAQAIVAELIGCTEVEATMLLDRADGDVRLAVLLAKGASIETSKALLKDCGGNLRAALAEISARALAR